MLISEIIARENLTIEDKLSHFIQEYTDDQYCLLELLLFWGRHPRAHFSLLAIVHALDCRKLYMERALKYLIARGLVKTHTDNGVRLYSLTDDESLRQQVLAITELKQR